MDFLLYDRYRRYNTCVSALTRKEIMSATVYERADKSEQPPIGYVTHTNLGGDDDVIYGVFNTIDEAIAFGDKLITAIIKPIYRPSLH